MTSLALIALSLISVQPLLDSSDGRATVSATRVYVTSKPPELSPSDELVRCAETLEQALTPSLGTLMLAKDQADADVVVELSACAINRHDDVYEIDWSLSRDDRRENFKLRRTLTRSRTDDWQMTATTKDLATHLLRQIESTRSR